MKVFISWSGERSKALASALREWLPGVIQAVKPFASQHDIDKGSRWSGELGKALESTKTGLLCVTSDNRNAPWLIFEAGVLSKELEGARVVPILFGLAPADIDGPLAQFQLTVFTRRDMFKTVQAINAGLGDSALDPSLLERAFGQNWDVLETQVNAILSAQPHEPSSPPRTERALLEEVLTLLRSMARADPETERPTPPGTLLEKPYRTVPLGILSGSQVSAIEALAPKNVIVAYRPSDQQHVLAVPADMDEREVRFVLAGLGFVDGVPPTAGQGHTPKP